MTGRSEGRRVHVMQGEAKVDEGPDTILTTLLGSCVAACIRDPGAGVGGMNHFLLPGSSGQEGARAESFGLYLMELLINGLLQRGARRGHLEAKLFGGARAMDGLSEVGSKNAAFAERFLQMENITYLGGSLGGGVGRRIEYWPHTGRARQIFFEKAAMPVIQVAPPIRKPQSIGEVELF
ncbi:MAG TPA: chemotaxis protein CheD [Aurantimonas coralicida]|uniref:Chemoreceptor glutamine deamidase CheD n=2 Tax=root TaxID=1 RepID=A0A0F9RV55_9ZZZZ|nr:chemotaxis protein CheD [Aurantimonas sp. A3-2-R12]HDZ74727.1 chemotaxis protein CheD [Aurantimonas coralicida]HEU03181.1 chemotaxis protein CheD [Aurantimonas coralicida]